MIRVCNNCKEEAHDDRLLICTSCGKDLVTLKKRDIPRILNAGTSHSDW